MTMAQSSGDFIMKKDCVYDECRCCFESLQENPKPEKGNQCGVVYKTSCNHEYQSICLLEWVDSWYIPVHKLGKPSCPVCRRIFQEHEMITLYALINNCLTDDDKYKTSEYIKGYDEKKV